HLTQVTREQALVLPSCLINRSYSQLLFPLLLGHLPVVARLPFGGRGVLQGDHDLAEHRIDAALRGIGPRTVAANLQRQPSRGHVVVLLATDTTPELVHLALLLRRWNVLSALRALDN